MAILAHQAFGDSPFEQPATSELLVKYRENNEGIRALHRQHGASEQRPFKHLRWSIVKLPPNANAHRARDNYRKSGLFEVVQTPLIYTADVVPNDTYWTAQWGPAKIQAPLAWDKFTGSNNVVVAVIDTGIDYFHADLRDNLWTGPNGEHGYTIQNGVVTEGGLDNHYHGTHVAGTIGAVGNNALGVAGLNWRVQLISFKFLHPSGSSFDGALAIDKMIQLKQQGVPIRVSNNSWGGIGYDAILEDAFTAAQNNGILNICAAGNNGVDTDLTYFSPSAIPIDGIISVLASDQSDKKASFSNFGATSTDILAPGHQIYSTQPGDRYQYLSGTSMAAPHVAGVVAAMYAKNPRLTVEEARNVLLEPESYDLTEFKQNSTGGGRINMAKLLSNPHIGNPPTNINHAPRLTLNITNDLYVIPSGQTVNIIATATDPDGDDTSINSSLRSDADQNWLTDRWLALNYRTNDGNTITIKAVPAAIDVAPQVKFSANDGHGGGASASLQTFVYRDATAFRDLKSIITGWNVTYSPETEGYRVRFRLNVSGPTNGLHYAFTGAVDVEGFTETCCFQVNTDQNFLIPPRNPGSITTVRAQLADDVGNYAQTEPVLIDVYNTGKKAPIINARFDSVRGPAPFTVRCDMSGSQNLSPGNMTYSFGYWHSWSFSDDPYNPVQTFKITTPGTWTITMRADNNLNKTRDQWVQLISVLPYDAVTPPPTNPPPVVDLTPPNDLRYSLSGSTVTLNWTDTAKGESRWEVWQSFKGKGPWGPWGIVATLPADARTYSKSLAKGTYQFKVRACATNCGNYSNGLEFRLK